MVIAALGHLLKSRLSRCRNYNIDKDITPLCKTNYTCSLSKFHRLITDLCLPSRIDIRRFGERRLPHQPPRLTSCFDYITPPEFRHREYSVTLNTSCRRRLCRKELRLTLPVCLRVTESSRRLRYRCASLWLSVSELYEYLFIKY
jgi:hypothetical protein